MPPDDAEKATDFSRRAFLRASGGALGGSLLALHLPAIVAAAEAAAVAREAGAAFLNLSALEAAGLEAVAARIIPTDETPGAREAGVIHFIDQSLGSFMAEAAGELRGGLAALDTRAAAAGGKAFAGLDNAAQDALLREIEQTPFFGLMQYLTVAGMFSLPSYGGNRDYLGWKLLDFDHRHGWSPPFGHYDAEAGGTAAASAATAGEHKHD